MSTAIPRQTPAPQVLTQAAPEDANNKTLLETILDRPIEYEAFLSKERISLTPRMVMKFLCKPTKSGKLCTHDQALRFCMLCRARGLNPWEGDAFIVGYDSSDGPEFSLITAHQAFLKRAEVHPEYDGMESGVIVQIGNDITEREGDFFLDQEKLKGGWARIYLRNRSHPVFKSLRLEAFNKAFGRWKVDPAGMIVKCAEADALRSAFPNTLGGMYLEDELVHADAPPIAPISDQPIVMPKRKSEATITETASAPAEEATATGESAAEPETRREIAEDFLEGGKYIVINGVQFPTELKGPGSVVLLGSMDEEAKRAGINLYQFVWSNLSLKPIDLNEEAARCMVEVLRALPDKKKSGKK